MRRPCLSIYLCIYQPHFGNLDAELSNIDNSSLDADLAALKELDPSVAASMINSPRYGMGWNGVTVCISIPYAYVIFYCIVCHVYCVRLHVCLHVCLLYHHCVQYFPSLSLSPSPSSSSATASESSKSSKFPPVLR